MKNHTNDCGILTTGVCTCMVTEPHPHPGFTHRFGRPPRDAQELAEWLAVEANKGRGKAGVVSKNDPNYRIPENARSMRAGTSRRIDTDPKVTWLGDQRLVHPLSCGVYKSPEPNWAPYCDCGISRLQHRKIEPEVPETDPADFREEFTSRAPWWVWSLIGFGAGLPLGAWAGWPSW